LKSVGKKLSKNIPLALVSKIPIIGDIISATVSSFIEAHDEKKINNLLSIINEKLHNLDESKIDKTYLESDEFKDFIIKILKITREISLADRDFSFSEKVRFFASLVTENILIDRLKTKIIWRDTFIDIIKNLNDDELKFFRIMYDHSKKSKPLSITSTVFNSIEQKKSCVNSLISKGLIDDASIQKAKDRFSPGLTKVIKKEGLIIITDFGYEVIEYMFSIQKNLKENFLHPVNC